PWVRTMSDHTQVIRPTVIAGVTFSAKPRTETPNHPQPWISLNKDGSPKTIKPKLKGAFTKNGPPDYGTYFAEKVTRTVTHVERVQGRYGPTSTTKVEEVIEHIDLFDEDAELNPLIRCTPDRYFDEQGRIGSKGDGTSEPFCSPWSASHWLTGRTYFVTWYPGYFNNTASVRVLLEYAEHGSDSQIKKTLYGSRKGKAAKEEDDEDYERQHVDDAFYVGEWVPVGRGWQEVTVLKSWLQNKFSKHVYVSLQTSNDADDAVD
ncbi:hypothetical protein CANCADRAFT_17609, partial [Tortispora caseinolytica NRRL Y-17796]